MKNQIAVILVFINFFLFISCNERPELIFNTELLYFETQKGFYIEKIEIFNKNGIKGVDDIFIIKCNNKDWAQRKIFLNQTYKSYIFEGGKVDSIINIEPLYYHVYISRNGDSYSAYYQFGTFPKSLDSVYKILPFRLFP